MKKNSIASKILRAFLLVCLVSLGIGSIVTVFSLFNVRKITLTGADYIGAIAAESSGEAMRDMAIIDLTELVKAKSETIDRELRTAVSGLEMLKDYAEEIFRRPGDFLPRPFPNVHDVAPDTLKLHWFFDDGIISNPQYNESDLRAAGLLRETYLLGNLETICRLVMEHTPNILGIFFITKQGLNIHYDRMAATKVHIPEMAFLGESWNRVPFERNTMYISEVYQDFFGRGQCLTISVPWYDSGVCIGVVAIDISIEDLNKSVQEIVTGSVGYAILLNYYSGSAAERALAKAESEAQGSPVEDDAKETQIISAPVWDGYSGMDSEDFWLNTFGSFFEQMEVISKSHEYVNIAVGDENYNVTIIWDTVNLTGWHLVYIALEEKLFASARELNLKIIEMTDITVRRVGTTIMVTMVISGVLLLVLILITLWAARLISDKITRPITVLSGNVKLIGTGNLDYSSNIKTGDEIEELDISFERMTAELREYIDNLSRVTAEKERIGAELNVAKQIQASMLPCIFPPFPHRSEFDIFATMQPAKEVGGDFYDFFMSDDNTLAVVIADVSGNGVAAALFMVIAKTLIKNNAQAGKSPKEVFEIVNNLLCENNEAHMFVTVFMGYLDVRSGKFAFVNAGHNPPLIKRKDTEFEWLKVKSGFVLAARQNMPYEQYETILGKDDMLFLYTDGVTEAVNHEYELFSDSRLLLSANKYKDLPPEGFLRSIKTDVDQFADGTEQADDITMLALRITHWIKCHAGYLPKTGSIT